jgi:hypothetical protein
MLVQPTSLKHCASNKKRQQQQTTSNINDDDSNNNRVHLITTLPVQVSCTSLTDAGKDSAVLDSKLNVSAEMFLTQIVN